MTFLTLLLVLTQTVSVGVVDKPIALANGTRLMPGDRVLAIHDSTHPWITFMPSGEFTPIDSSKVIISGEWHTPRVKLSDHPEAESGLWSQPDRQSQRVRWHVVDLREYFSPFMPKAFCYRDSSFWAPLHAGDTTGWFQLTQKEVLASISGFGPSTDSSRARALFDLADKLRLDEGEREETSRNKTVAHLYELSLETCSRLGDLERIAEALLTLATFEAGLGEDSVALALYRRSARELAGVKSSFGRTDAYANWQMMELAWRHKDTVQTRSLARKIIVDYPAQMAEARVTTWVGDGPSPMYATRSIWFDFSAANRLLETVASDESRLTEAAEFLTESKCLAVRFRGYDKLIALSEKRSDSSTAVSYARAALSLPHYTQLEVWPPSACTHPGGRRQHDFKNEFIDSLDVLLPFVDLLRLYDNSYNSKDTMMSRDAANWFMRHIEQGRTPPRAGILERIDPPRNPTELKHALLVSMIGARQFRTAVECTLFTHRPDDYPNVDRVVTQVLPRGSLVQPYVMREGLVRVATPSGLSGWTDANSLRGTVRLWDISAVQIVTNMAAEPLSNADINVDGVRDLGLSTMDVLDGKGLAAVRPATRPYVYVYLTGFFRHKWVELRHDTLWLRGAGADTVAMGVPVARKAKRGACKQGSCFYFVAGPNPNDSFAWLSAVGERGTVWTTPIPVRKLGADAIYQIGSTLIVAGRDSARLFSPVNGAERGRIATPQGWRSWRGVFFNRSGYTVAKGESLIYHDYSGSREFGFSIGKSDAKLLPPFAASFETDVWGAGRFGQLLCPIEAEAIPVVTLVHRYVDGRSYYDIAMHLVSLRDGRELATVSMSENYYDCHYDERGIYVSDDAGFRAVTWEGKPLAVADLPLLSYPIWDGDRIVSYYSRPMGTMFEAGAASRLADVLRPLRSRWPGMDSRWESGWRGE
jgi:hypothetical protein